ncbi:MAG TPA: DUF302 domain-containing protein [Rhodocyclaceae bacterium]
MENQYGFGKTVQGDFAGTRERVIDELGKEGFGVLTEIDVAATMKKKLDHDMAPYVILGACNPPFAKRAIEAEPTIGLLMPCNVVVRQDAAGIQVEFMDPGLMSQMTANDAVVELAKEVREKIRRVMDAV